MKVLDDKHVLIPDASGNNRLDTLTNIVASGQVSLLFMVPGINETLRIKGRARLTDDEELMALFGAEKHPPKLLIEVTIADAYLQCPKAYMRSRFRDPEARVDRSIFPSLAQIIKEQTASTESVEIQAEAEQGSARAGLTRIQQKKRPRKRGLMFEGDATSCRPPSCSGPSEAPVACPPRPR